MSTYSPSPDQVRAALNELLGWSELVRSPQLSKFLNHVVEAKLRGEEASIKAYSIAVDVLGRPPTFDPQSDPIVRVQARRLRGLLQEYYRQNRGRSGAIITLPVGRYVPEFELVEAGEALVATVDESEAAIAGSVVDPPERQRLDLGRLQSFWAQVLAAMTLVLLLGLLLYGLQVFRDQPAGPSVALPPTPKIYLATYVTPPGQLDVFSARLADQIGSLLARAEDIEIGFDDGSTPIERRAGVMMLTGAVVPSGTSLRVDSLLHNALSGELIWGNSIMVPRPGADDTVIAAVAARRIVRELRPGRGPVHVAAMRWVEQQDGPLPGVTPYLCRLTYMIAREELESASVNTARSCYERLLAQAPDEPSSLAAKAWLDGRQATAVARRGEQLGATLESLARVADRARRLAPNSSFVHQQLASIETWRGNFDGAQRNYAISLAFDPLNTDARAGYATTLARLDQWGEAARQAQLAIADTPYPSAWYYALPMLLALRADAYEEAMVAGQNAAPASEIGLVGAIAAAGFLGNSAVVAELLPDLMARASLKESGILPWLRLRVGQEAAVLQIAEGLRAAGVSEAALTGPF